MFIQYVFIIKKQKPWQTITPRLLIYVFMINVKVDYFF